MLIVMLVLALGAPLFGRYDPADSVLTAFEQPPSAAHWFGTDSAGRDVWSRLIWGGRNSLFIGICAVTIATTIGTLVGAVSGFYRGILDGLLMRITDAFLAFPSIVLILMLASVLGPSIINVVIVLGVLSWTGIARLVRGQFLTLREQDWVMAARAVGVTNSRLICAAPAAARHLAGADRRDLRGGGGDAGRGRRSPTSAWGCARRRRAGARCSPGAQSIHVLQSVAWSWLAPGLTLTIVVLAINYVGRHPAARARPVFDAVSMKRREGRNEREHSALAESNQSFSASRSSLFVLQPGGWR